MTQLTFISTDPAMTRAIGEALGALLPDGAVVLLNGDLGAGKTTLTQGIARGFGVPERAQSPTFTLVAEHQGRDERMLYHLDLYRLQDEAELESFGYEQFIAPEGGVSIIEWPERAGSWLPDAYLLIDIEIAGPSARRLRMVTHGALELDLSGLAAAAHP